MTGQHTGHTRIRGNNAYPLLPEDFTVAEVLKSAKHKTGLFGKWGLGLQNTTGAPSQQGFDEFLGFLSQTHAHEYYPTSIWRHLEYSSQLGADREFYVPLNENTNNQRRLYIHDLFTKAGTNFLRINTKFPFFLSNPPSGRPAWSHARETPSIKTHAVLGFFRAGWAAPNGHRCPPARHL